MREYGVPERIRTGNGAPFSGTGILGLSRLSLERQRLSIVHERIQPGKPQQNGRHERMHRTLKQDTANPSAKTLGAQQRRFDEFRRVYNYERPHEARSAMRRRQPLCAERQIVSPLHKGLRLSSAVSDSTGKRCRRHQLAQEPRLYH